MLAIENVILENLLGIFGGNYILMSICLIGLIVGGLLMLRVPFPITFPVALGFFILLTGFVPELTVIIGLIVGTMLAYFVFRMWSGR